MCPPGSCLWQQQAHPTLQRPAETGAAGQDGGAARGPVGTQLLGMGALRWQSRWQGAGTEKLLESLGCSPLHRCSMRYRSSWDAGVSAWRGRVQILLSIRASSSDRLVRAAGESGSPPTPGFSWSWGRLSPSLPSPVPAAGRESRGTGQPLPRARAPAGREGPTEATSDDRVS